MKSIKKDLTVTQARNVLYRTGVNVYGNMPPMLQINLALEAVKKGDFSEPARRSVIPVPSTDIIDDSNNTPPSSWTEPTTDVVVGDGGDVVVTNPVGEDVVVSPINAPTPNNDGESDYDAIRRLIAIYKQKIKDLEGQLPENKK
jgi:hypothetical protein